MTIRSCLPGLQVCEDVRAIAIHSNQATMIAIIDDDPSVRQALESLVASHGYPAAAFASSEEFLADAPLEEIRCILTDVHMARMSGLELLDFIKQRYPSLPVIVMTAFFDEPTQSRALASGANILLAKPFSSATLMAAIRRATQP